MYLHGAWTHQVLNTLSHDWYAECLSHHHPNTTPLTLQTWLDASLASNDLQSSPGDTDLPKVRHQACSHHCSIPSGQCTE